MQIMWDNFHIWVRDQFSKKMYIKVFLDALYVNT